MQTNEQIILGQLLAEKKAQVAPDLGDDKYFEVFSAEQTLKSFDLSYEELESGIVDGGGDGGIDAIYFFANGELVQEDTDLSGLKKDVVLELVIIQAKNQDGFKEAPLDKLRGTLEHALTFATDFEKMAVTYNEDVRAAVGRFRSVYTTLIPRFPAVKITLYYTSKGTEVHDNVRLKVKPIRDVVAKTLSSATFEFEFVTAKRLVELARQSAPTSFGLTLAENPISTGSAGFVCLVRLREYHKFVVDQAGHLRRNLFEANVRDYQGTTEVNEGIHATLAGAPLEDFWWLNNGITVLAADAALTGGKVLTLKDPQIVNGLQTSTEVYEVFKSKPDADDPRNILVRVLVTNDPASRDRIIKATNSQNSMPSASLRATDKVQRDIEDFFLGKGFFYDRRKNFYKNQGKPIEKVISIPYLAQAVMAIVVREPHNSRGKPSSLLKRDEDYKRVFDTKYSVELFLSCVNIMKRVEGFLRSRPDLVDPKYRNNVKFHMSMLVVARSLGTPKPKPEQIANLASTSLTAELLHAAALDTLALFLELGGTDQVAKRKEFSEKLALSLEIALAKAG